MDDVIFVEKFCSVCGKMSWDSTTGDYNETHEIGRRHPRTVACNTVGTQVETFSTGRLRVTYFNGRVELYDINGKLVED
jgi:hypothetical protein